MTDSKLCNTITYREVQNSTKDFCRAPTAQLVLKQFSETQRVNNWHAIPMFQRVTIQQTFPPEGCRRDELKSCRSAKHVMNVTCALAELEWSILHSESVCKPGLLHTDTLPYSTHLNLIHLDPVPSSSLSLSLFYSPKYTFVSISLSSDSELHPLF